MPEEAKKPAKLKKISSSDLIDKTVLATGWTGSDFDKYVCLVILDFLERVDLEVGPAVTESTEFWAWVADLLAPVCLSILHRKKNYQKVAQNALLRAFKQSIVCQFNSPAAEHLYNQKFGGNEQVH
jgi:hypothetical protein